MREEKGRLKQLYRLPPWFRGKESTCQCRRHRGCGFDPGVGKIPWRRKWQPTPVFLPGESHGQRILVGYSPRGRKESDTTQPVNKSSKHWCFGPEAEVREIRRLRGDSCPVLLNGHCQKQP